MSESNKRDEIQELTSVALLLESQEGDIMVPACDKYDDHERVYKAAYAILNQGQVSRVDLGCLVYFIADILEDVDNLR